MDNGELRIYKQQSLLVIKGSDNELATYANDVKMDGKLKYILDLPFTDEHRENVLKGHFSHSYAFEDIEDLVKKVINIRQEDIESNSPCQKPLNLEGVTIDSFDFSPKHNVFGTHNSMPLNEKERISFFDTLNDYIKNEYLKL